MSAVEQKDARDPSAPILDEEAKALLGAAEAAVKTLTGRLREMHPNLLERYSPAEYIRLAEDPPPLRGYQELDSRLPRLADEIQSLAGKEALDLYHRAVLLMLLQEMPGNVATRAYSDEVRTFFRLEMRRILSETGSNGTGFYSLDNDLFLKDIAIATLRMFPVGVLKVEERTGIPRGFLLANGIRQFFRGMFLIRALKGFHPYYEIHLDIRYRADFTPLGWDQSLMRTARMLKVHQDVKGMIGASWFFDPRIQTISPHLAYLRKRIEDNGGEFFYARSDERTTRLAVSASATRKRLYEAGKYRPASFMTIWPRDRMLDWAARSESTLNQIDLP